MALNERMDRFANEFVLDYHATNAAKRSGYAEKTAYSIGSRLLKNVEIQKRIKEIESGIFTKIGITKAKIYQQLLNIATFDIRTAYNESGSLMPINELPDSAASCITGVKVYDEFGMVGETKVKIGETVEVKTADKLNAIAQIVKIGGWAAPDKVEHKMRVGKDLADEEYKS